MRQRILHDSLISCWIIYAARGFSWFRTSSCGACCSFARVLRMLRKMAQYKAVWAAHAVCSAVFLAPPCLCLRFFWILLIMFHCVLSCNWTRLEQRTSYIAYHVIGKFNGTKWYRDLSCIGVGAYCMEFCDYQTTSFCKAQWKGLLHYLQAAMGWKDARFLQCIASVFRWVVRLKPQIQGRHHFWHLNSMLLLLALSKKGSTFDEIPMPGLWCSRDSIALHGCQFSHLQVAKLQWRITHRIQSLHRSPYSPYSFGLLALLVIPC